MFFMVIERYKNCDAKSVYLRAKEQGRNLPEGLTYLEAGLRTISTDVFN